MTNETAEQLKARIAKKKALENAAPILLYYLKEYHGWDDKLHTQAMPDCQVCKTIAKAEGRAE